MVSQYDRRARWIKIAALAVSALSLAAIFFAPRSSISSLDSVQLARIFLAVAIGAVSVVAILWPDSFFGVKGGFCISARRLEPDRSVRLERALAARENAEAISRRATLRYFAAAGFALAALELLPAIPPVIPYALFCLALAVVILLAYLQFRRAMERRVAPLVRRSVLTSLPLPVIIAMACCFAGELAFTSDPAQRFGAIVVALATLTLAVIAWRVAVAPALLLGADPQVEYAVDERLRKVRAISIAVLACGVGVLFASVGTLHIPDEYAYLRFAEEVITCATLVAVLSNVFVLSGRLAFA